MWCWFQSAPLKSALLMDWPTLSKLGATAASNWRSYRTPPQKNRLWRFTWQDTIALGGERTMLDWKPKLRRWRGWYFAVILCAGAASVAAACENAVRDAGFHGPRDIHRLCLITATDDDAAAAQRQRLADWLAGPAAGLNLELVHLCADDPDVQWTSYGIPSAPPSLAGRGLDRQKLRHERELRHRPLGTGADRRRIGPRPAIPRAATIAGDVG